MGSDQKIEPPSWGDTKRLPDTRAGLDAELNELVELGPEALRARWFKLFGHTAPRSLPSQKLARAIAYRLQAAFYGVEDTLVPAHGVYRFSCLSEGVGAPVLLRRFWDGQDHEVTRDGKAFLYKGQRYGSLSAVARAITGTRWNGWTFFGLKSPARTIGDGARG